MLPGKSSHFPSRPEVWLRPNRRAMLLGMILPLLFAFLAIGAAAYSVAAGFSLWWGVVGSLLAAFGLYLIASLAFSLSVPRLAYEDGDLLVFVVSREPVRVPIDVVEVFFVGQG